MHVYTCVHTERGSDEKEIESGRSSIGSRRGGGYEQSLLSPTWTFSVTKLVKRFSPSCTRFPSSRNCRHRGDTRQETQNTDKRILQTAEKAARLTYLPQPTAENENPERRSSCLYTDKSESIVVTITMEDMPVMHLKFAEDHSLQVLILTLSYLLSIQICVERLERNPILFTLHVKNNNRWWQLKTTRRCETL
jgi:hypothetical protein